MQQNKTTPVLIIGAFIAILALAAVASFERVPSADTPGADVVRAVAIDPSIISGKAAILFDPVRGEILFDKHADLQLPLASLTKLAAAAVALESGAADVTIEPQDLRLEGDSGLRLGETWSLQKLVAFALRTSSNHAIAAAARAATGSGSGSTTSLNDLAQSMGLTQTYFLNPTGLDFSSSTAGAYGSARDVAVLISEVLRRHPEVLSATLASAEETYADDSGTVHAAIPTTAPITDIPGLIAAKTGFTDLAGGNLAVVFDRGVGEPMVAVVLGSSRDGRFTDVRTLIEAARSASASTDPL